MAPYPDTLVNSTDSMDEALAHLPSHLLKGLNDSLIPPTIVNLVSVEPHKTPPKPLDIDVTTHNVCPP